ncbi:MAG TPA: anthranilate synthase component I family protein [Thermoplasmata archaeon]|nr:anthranilate synthase component I family protein [Thermoplasmata archaeon]
MTDAFDRFLAESEGAECVGYFEERPRSAQGPGQALYYTSAAKVVSVTAKTFPRDLDRALTNSLDRRAAAVGYLSFEATGLFEPLLARVPAPSPFPLGEFALVSEPRTERLARRSFPPENLGGREQLLATPTEDSLPRPRFLREVVRLQDAIRRGDAFQVVLAHRRSWPRPDDLLLRARRLRHRELYRYFFYLRFGDREILGASPESVLTLDGATARLHPIAGTLPRPRGRRLRLSEDPKELAEHRMLVDLARNDLGRISRPGSVRVAVRERIERFARLEHLVSEVVGTLRTGVGPFEALGAAFPAGTVSGAPKIRATQLLQRSERTWRGPYAGAVGYLRAGGHAHWALPIRTAFARGRTLYTAAGAGIVHRSQAGREWTETLVKLAELERQLVGVAR